MALRSLANLVLRPLSLAVRGGCGLVLKGNVDEVRAAVGWTRITPISGVEITGRAPPPLNPSCAFLADLQSIRYLRIFAAGLTEIESVQALKQLRHLSVVHLREGQSIHLNLAALPALERLEVEWFDGAETLFEARGLKSLSLAEYPSSSSKALKGLTKLTTLRLSAGRLIEIDAVKDLNALTWVAILRQVTLEEFSGLTAHPAIRFLWMEGCKKLKTLRWLEGMSRLETLRLLDCGAIAELEVVRSLPALRHIHIFGKDGAAATDARFLRNLAGLESVVIKGLSEDEADYWKQRNTNYNLMRSDLRGRA
jgi:hypothetical protein